MPAVHRRNLREGKHLFIYWNEDKPYFHRIKCLKQQILPRWQSSENLTSNVLADKGFFCPPWSTVMNATFCSYRDWEYPDPHFTQRSRDNPSPQTSGQLTSTSQTIMRLCFPPVHCSFCLASHWGWSSWLAIQGEQAKTWNAIQHVSPSWLWLTTFTPLPWPHIPGFCC